MDVRLKYGYKKVYKKSAAAIIGRYKQVSDVIRINVDILARKSSVFAVCTRNGHGGCTKPNTPLRETWIEM
jgi:hypothetical protein